MPQVEVIHSCPAWTQSPRSPHGKFGGNTLTGGFESVADRLRAIKRAFPNDRTSLHSGHELVTEVFEHNNPGAITFGDLNRGMDNGDYPGLVIITAPAFGWPGVQQGAILNADAAIRQTVHDLHKEAIVRTQELRGLGYELEDPIWWPAWDGRSHAHGDRCTLTREQALPRLRDFWVELLEETNGCINLEFKPAVPADEDYLNTLFLALAFAQEVNENLGRIGVKILNEWAHLLIGGMPVEEGTRITISSGLGGLYAHVNSAELAMVRHNKYGDVTAGAPSDDKDWAVGDGGPERYIDQELAVDLMVAHALKTGKPIIAEHDIDPAGEDGIEFYRRSRTAFDEMVASCLTPT